MATMHKVVRDGTRTEALQWLSAQLCWEHALDRLRSDDDLPAGAVVRAA